MIKNMEYFGTEEENNYFGARKKCSGSELFHRRTLHRTKN